MVIEEVNVLQTQLEIEKSCRENAEALATKVFIQQYYSSVSSENFKSPEIFMVKFFYVVPLGVKRGKKFKIHFQWYTVSCV